MAFRYRLHCKDFFLLFFTRILRMFSYGMLAVIFFDNLFLKGLNEMQAAWMQTAIVAGDIIISLYLTTQADKIGRINTLMLGSLLKFITGLVYAYSQNVIILVVTGIFGVISVSGGEIGPFMPIEQSALSQLVQKCTQQQNQVPKNIAKVFGYYNMTGYLAQAGGSAFAGYFIIYYQQNCRSEYDAITTIVVLYAALGALKFICYYLMNPQSIEPNHVQDKKIVNCAGIQPENMKTIFTLSALFALDAFAGAFIVQSFISFYYEEKYDRNFSQIGIYLFICNVVSGISGILSSKLVQCFGAMATMVYTHLPSNILLLVIGFTDNLTVSLVCLIARFCISQMDVPARQTFVTMVVSSSERSAANGITNIARSVGLSIGLGLNGFFMQMNPDVIGFSVPFLIAGGVKIIYDIIIGCYFLWNERQKKQLKFQLGSMELAEATSEVTHMEKQEQK